MEVGWHPDPTGRFQARYHDGADWTEHVSDGGATGADVLPPESQRPVAARSTCPICSQRDIVVTLQPEAALLCFSCGASIAFSIVGTFTPETRARLVEKDLQHRALLAELARKARR